MKDLKAMYDLLTEAISIASGRTGMTEAQASNLHRRARGILQEGYWVEGQLFMQPNGRWMLTPEGHHEFHCGDCLDLQREDGSWASTRLEHTQRDGFYAMNGMAIKDGMYARIYNGPIRIPARAED